MGNYVERMREPDVYPLSDERPTFDPSYGFSQPRAARAMKATEAEMFSAKLPLDTRDYCAHLLIDYQVCKKKEFPWVYRCEHANHVYQSCQYEDYKLRMKEYERERRLRHREKRLAAAAAQ